MDLEALRQALAAQPDIELAILFGSTARGSDHAESDVDLGILLNPASPAAHRAAADAAAAAVHREVDITELDDAPPLLRFQIARDGILLVERLPHAWSRFKARAMIDWWDWGPTARKLHATYIRRLREQAAHG